LRQLLLRLILLAAVATGGITAAAAIVLHAVEAHDHARREAEADAAALVSLVEVTADKEALLRGIGRTASGRSGRVAVEVDGLRVGNAHLTAGVVADGPAEVRVEGGTVLRRTIEARSAPASVEVFVPDWYLDPSALQAAAVLAGVALVAAAAATTVGMVRMRSVFADLAALIVMTREAGHEERSRQRPSMSTPETAAVAAGLESVGVRIENARSHERRVVADLSHRLRTPLTALSLDVSAIGPGPAADRVRAAAASLDRAVDSLIRAVPDTPGGPVEAVQCDVVEVVERRMAFWSALGRHGSRHSTVHLPPSPAPIPFQEEDLAAVVDALMGNVFRYTRDGTDFRVSVVRHAGWVTLVVDDAGPGFTDPAAALRRGVSSSGSTGLGLAIARDAVEATGGTIHIERSTLGGARIRLRFGEVGGEQAHSDGPRAWRLWRNRPRSGAPE
jgi:signal transduction histidine kinase